MILCVTLNPVVDTTLFVNEIRPVYRTEAYRITHLAGGKGNNVARALTGLGEPARVLTPLGGAAGRYQAELLAADGLEAVIAWVSGETRVVITVVDQAHSQRAFFAPVALFTSEDAAEVRRCFARAIMGADAMCLCGSSPGPLADVLFPEMLREARARGIPTLLDTYGEALRLGLEAEPTIVKVNRAEAAALLGRPLDTLDEQMRALDALRQAGATQWSILTLGADGALCASDEGCWQAQPPRVAAINTIGSGDAMTAGLLTGLLRGQSPQACFRLGMAAAVANTLTWDAGRLAADDVQAILPQIRLTALS